MKPAPAQPHPDQPDMFRPRLVDIIDPCHPLVKLADAIDWKVFETHLDPCFSDIGRQVKSVRLMVGLQYLKFTFDQSDEGVLEAWVENPYWQHFCGGVFFEHEPTPSSSNARGATGDKLNAMLSACGFNLRKLLRAFACALLRLWAALAKWCSIHLATDALMAWGRWRERFSVSTIEIDCNRSVISNLPMDVCGLLQE